MAWRAWVLAQRSASGFRHASGPALLRRCAGSGGATRQWMGRPAAPSARTRIRRPARPGPGCSRLVRRLQVRAREQYMSYGVVRPTPPVAPPSRRRPRGASADPGAAAARNAGARAAPMGKARPNPGRVCYSTLDFAMVWGFSLVRRVRPVSLALRGARVVVRVCAGLGGVGAVRCWWCGGVGSVRVVCRFNRLRSRGTLVLNALQGAWVAGTPLHE